MSRNTFMILCRELQPHIERQETRMRQPIVVQAQVAFTIRKLATNIEHQTQSELFGIGCSIVCTIVVETYNAIATHLFPWYMCFPTSERLRGVITILKHAGVSHSQCY